MRKYHLEETQPLTLNPLYIDPYLLSNCWLFVLFFEEIFLIMRYIESKLIAEKNNKTIEIIEERPYPSKFVNSK